MSDDGLYLRADPADSLGLLEVGTYEPFETDLLVRLAAPGSTVVDVGANVGYHTVQFARAVGPTGLVLAFEPDPDNARVLAHNVRTNDFSHVTIVPKAAAETTGWRWLFRSAENQGDHRLYDSHDGRPAVRVETIAIDELLSAVIGAVSIVKLDIQGAEPFALQGMRRLIDRHPEAWIATELWPAGLALAGSSVEAYLDQLRAFGVPLLRIDERHARLVPLDLDWLRETVTVDHGNHTNLLLPRRDLFGRA